VRVLDPACGSGNFLYVTLEHLKRLEGEVLDQLPPWASAEPLGLEGETVTLQQLRASSSTRAPPRWPSWCCGSATCSGSIRSFGPASVAEPVVHDYRNIECRDAVLAWDGKSPCATTPRPPRARWDGKTFKRHPVTGEPVPDETALVPQWRYLNPRPAEWPQADFIVGNPPFIGKLKMREALGDGYVEALGLQPPCFGAALGCIAAVAYLHGNPRSPLGRQHERGRGPHRDVRWKRRAHGLTPATRRIRSARCRG
jgi:hypothetical protein